MKYSDAQIKKAMKMQLEHRGGIYTTHPSSEKDVYKHKIKLDKEGNPQCGCKWSQVNLKKENKQLCSHSLAVLYRTNKFKFIKEVSKKQ